VDKEMWKQDADGITEFYKKFRDRLPQELSGELETLKNNLK
jgi:phosphoenolpyruvate carboxykinase [GTP]